MLSIGVLGPLEVTRNGKAVRVVGKPAALLVALVLRRNEVVTTDRLLDDLWGERAPRSARKLIQAYVSQLRRAIGRERLRTFAAGYSLALEDRELDLAMFERDVRDAHRALGRDDAARADALLRAALDLWRGPALSDLREAPFARAATARLDELRLDAVETAIEARLALGAHREVLAELEALVSEHQTRERLRGHLMLALYRSGRQADALDRFREGRELLVSSLGLEPAPELRRLQEAILRQDPALEASAPVVPSPSFLLAADDEVALELLGPLARRRGRELVVVRPLAELAELAEATDALTARRAQLAGAGVSARVAAFHSTSPMEDVARLAGRPGVELALVSLPRSRLGDLRALAPLLTDAGCDVAMLVRAAASSGRGPVVVAFAGGHHDWAALELGVGLAQAHERELVVAGGQRGGADASRALAAASLAVQRVADVVARPLVIPTGADALRSAAAGATALLFGVPDDWRRRGLGDVRSALASEPPAPLLFVRKGVGIGAVTAEEVTRFTWSV